MQAARNRIVLIAATVAVLGLVAFAVSRQRDTVSNSEIAAERNEVAMTPPIHTGNAVRRSHPVDLNREIEVADGFRGEVHPLLHGSTALEVTAQWTPVGTGRDRLEESVPPVVYRLFQQLNVAEERRTYTERQFSAFMPPGDAAAGQIWSLDAGRIRRFLEQFHAKPSLELVASGRRGGPNGAFAVLRARSPTHLDIVFRIHAEFDLTPDVWRSPVPLSGAWYTPACFEGRMIVNREAGVVDGFALALPAEKTLNVHLTVAHPRGDNHDIVHVDRMELSGGDSRLPEQIAWTEEMTLADAHDSLKRVFYRFEEIDWVPVQQALAVARERQQPIVAMVMWGALDDQSC